MSNKLKRLNPLSRSYNTNSAVLRNHFNVHPNLSSISTTISHQGPNPLNHRPPNIPKREISESYSLNPVKQRRLSGLGSKNDNQALNTANFNRNIERTYIRSSSLKQASSFINAAEREYQLNIHFASNWGHPNLITCSEIDILGKDKTPLQKVSISEYIPKDPNNADEPYIYSNLNSQFFDRMCNHILIKETKDDSWYSNWNPKSKIPLILNINIISKERPEYIRIWNSKYLPESNLRNFTVHYERQIVGQGEVPINFCVVTKLNSEIIKPVPIAIPPLCDPTTLEQIQEHHKYPIPQKKSNIINFGIAKEEMLSIFQEEVNSLDCDKYGKMFVPRVKRLKFTLLEAFDPDSNEMGLNSIELFDVNGKSFSFSHIKSVNILNGKCVSSPFKLFKDHRRTMDSSDMWICEKEIDEEKKNNPNCSKLDLSTKLTVDLSKEKKIVLIRIWNYNGFNEFNHYGVKKMRIDSDKGFLWRGILNEAKGMTSKIIDGITDIWLTDKTPWIDCPQISEYRTSRFQDSSRSSVEYSSSREPTERTD